MTMLQRTYDSIDRIGQQTDIGLLFCSLGKDSLVLLDLLYPAFQARCVRVHVLCKGT